MRKLEELEEREKQREKKPKQPDRQRQPSALEFHALVLQFGTYASSGPTTTVLSVN